MGLLRPSQLAALRRLTEKLFDDTADIYKRSASDSDYGDDELETFTFSASVPCWLRSMPEDSVNVSFGQAQVPATHRLFVPVGTDVQSYDRVIVGGSTFQVMDTSVESTHKVLLRVSLRKSE